MIDNDHELAQIIDSHLIAYNQRDLEAFAKFYSETVKIWNFSKPEEVYLGKSELKRLFAKTFGDSPNLKSVVRSRQITPPFLIDEEWVTGLPAYPDGLHISVVYKIENDLIQEMCFVR